MPSYCLHRLMAFYVITRCHSVKSFGQKCSILFLSVLLVVLRTKPRPSSTDCFSPSSSGPLVMAHVRGVYMLRFGLILTFYMKHFFFTMGKKKSRFSDISLLPQTRYCNKAVFLKYTLKVNLKFMCHMQNSLVKLCLAIVSEALMSKELLGQQR